MIRRRSRSDAAPSYDSFLDIVTNVVGILIILVMVVGVRAKDAFQAARGAASADHPTPAHSSQESDLSTAQQKSQDLANQFAAAKRAFETAQGRAAAIHQDIAAVVERSALLERELAARSAQRQRLSATLAFVRKLLDRKSAEKGEVAAAAVADQREIGRLERRLAQLHQAYEALDREDAPVVIEHVPTPIAKTVFGREEHYRLLGGRIAYVPLNAFTERLKAEIPHKLWRLGGDPSFTETTEEIDGFRMQYTIESATFTMETRAGPIQQKGAQLDRFVLLPVREPLGESVDDALREGSRFLRELERVDPRGLTVTLWTYPDSHDDFRRVKQKLADLGIAVAARPMPQGTPIGGSPHGSRSAAE